MLENASKCFITHIYLPYESNQLEVWIKINSQDDNSLPFGDLCREMSELGPIQVIIHFLITFISNELSGFCLANGEVYHIWKVFLYGRVLLFIVRIVIS